MKLSTDSALAAALGPWAERMRARMDIPVLVRWKGSNGIKLGQFDKPAITLDVRNAQGAAALLSPTLETLGGAYIEGHLDVEGSVQDMIELTHRGIAASGGEKSLGLPQRLAGKIATFRHTRERDKQANQYHYDVSNEFYTLWLDPEMVYTCAYFERGDETLEQAQIKKLDHILTKLRVQPGHRLLDMGCGWGALVIRAAQKYGARCLGVTVSQQQVDWGNQRIKALGLEGQVEICLRDYRDVQGQFDRISMIGMFEHVGLKNLSSLFKMVHDLLTPEGWALIHGLTTPRHDTRKSISGARFIQRYVFPGSELPHIGAVLTRMQEGGLEAVDVEGRRRHYMRTLEFWIEAFEANSERIRTLVDDRYWRMFRVYLMGCWWAMDHDQMSIYQVLCHRAGQSALTLPWSRRWMYEGKKD